MGRLYLFLTNLRRQRAASRNLRRVSHFTGLHKY